MFPISWYLYLVYFIAMVVLSVKFVTPQRDGTVSLWDKYWSVCCLVLMLPVSLFYFGESGDRLNPILVIGIAAVSLLLSAYLMLSTLKDVYYDDDDVDQDSDEQDDDEYNTPRSSITLDHLNLAEASAGAKKIDLDQYGKPANPVKQGEAIAALFSPLANKMSTADALDTLNASDDSGNDDGDSDDDDGYLGMIMLWVMLGPLAYYAYSILLRHLNGLF